MEASKEPTVNKKVNLKARLKQKFAKVWRKIQLKKISAGADAGEGGPTESLQAGPPTLTAENDAASAEVTSDEAAPNDPRVLDTLSISTASGGDSSNIAHLRPTGDLKPPSTNAGLSTIVENTIQSAVGDSLDSANGIEQDAGQPDVSAISATDGEAKKSKDWTLWEMARKDLESKDPQSKYLLVLQKNFDSLSNRDTIANDIETIVDEKQLKVRGTDGITESRTRQILTSSARLVSSTRNLGMGLARLDPHGIAPIVLGGIYTVFQIIQNDSDDRRTALALTLDIADTVALWNSIEKYQISKNLNPVLEPLYEKLRKRIIQLYQRVMVLLGEMMAYLDRSRWGQIFNAIIPDDPAWTRQQDEMKKFEGNCDKIKSEIDIAKENEDRNSTVLKWVCPKNVQGSHKQVVARTKVNERYSSRCQWLIQSDEFKNWCTPGVNSVLWLNGNIGTGKSTLMARAVDELNSSSIIQVYNLPLAIFFFQKISKSNNNLWSVEKCLQSLARELSWDSATAQVDPSTDQKHNDLKSKHPEDGDLSSEDCLDLLKDLISKRETYIMIDAIDECEDPVDLLRKLSSLRLHTTGKLATPLPFHIMFGGRTHIHFSNFFSDFVPITTSHEQSWEDEEYYIDSEIDNICVTQRGSLFCTPMTPPKKGYPTRAKEILKKKSGGLFRWIEIQVDKFARDDWGSTDLIDDELDWLEQHTANDELDEEYARLFQLMRKTDRHGRNQDRAEKMLRLIACSLDPLSVDELADAVSVENGVHAKHRLTTDSVRRILTGFIREIKLPDSPRGKFRIRAPNIPFVQFAHASVFEYLTSLKSEVKDFTLSKQHSEAALVSISRIKALIVQLGSPPTINNFEPFKPSGFLKYSCRRWAKHCRLALDQKCDDKLPLLKIREFLRSNEYKVWNDFLISDMYEAWSSLVDPQEPTAGLFLGTGHQPHDICNRGSSPKPGFLIASYNLVELLEFPDLLVQIHLQDINANGCTLLHHLLRYCDRHTVSRFVELRPDEVMPSDGVDTLEPAARKGYVSIVRTLLQNGEDVHGSSPTSPQYSATLSSCQSHLSGDTEAVEALQRTIQLLLKHGANLYEVSSFGLPSIHTVVKSNNTKLLELLINHTIRLENDGVHGSTQRLLRMKNRTGQTPEDYATPTVTKYLKDQLIEAVERDGNIMYEFGDADIPGIRLGHIDETELKVFLSNPRAEQFAPKYFRLHEIASDYRRWCEKRYNDLDREYKAKEHEVRVRKGMRT